MAFLRARTKKQNDSKPPTPETAHDIPHLHRPTLIPRPPADLNQRVQMAARRMVPSAPVASESSDTAMPKIYRRRNVTLTGNKADNEMKIVGMLKGLKVETLEHVPVGSPVKESISISPETK